MTLTRLFLKRPTLAFVVIALTLIAAGLALRSLVVQELPNAGQPSITVTAQFSGASTTELVTEVAEPIEDQLAGTPYMQALDTTIQSGEVQITAQFATNSTDTENIANVEEALQAAERQLPTTMQPPTIRVANPSETIVISLALVSQKYAEPVLAAIANNSIVPVMEQVPGVANVIVTGTTQPAFMVTVDPNLLAADNLTLTDVVNSITPNNIRAPGGYVYQPGRETSLDIRGDLPDVQSVANLPIHVAYTAPGGTTAESTTATGGAGTSSASAGTSSAAVAAAPGIAPSVGASAAAASAGTTAGAAASAAPVSVPTGGFSSTSSTTASTVSSTTGTGSTTVTTSAQAAPSVPVDQPVSPGSISSNSVTDSAGELGAALPSASSSAFGTGTGTSLSPFVGELAPWVVPSADKRIGDVAQVIDGSVVQRVYSSEDGKPGVTLLVQKQTQASEVTVADAILKQLPSLRAKFPGVDFELAHNQSTYTEQQVQGVEHTLIEGIVLTAVVMVFFLASWRNAVVVMIAIPTSLGVTLFFMDVDNLTLDTISLMALTLVIGILIDDSTVVLENIERHRSMGEEPADAALNGRTEIGLAAIVLTTVDVIVFLPIAFAGGQVGQYLHEFAIVITVATLTSLFVSFTITPTLAGLWSMKSEWRPWFPIRWFGDRFEGLRSRYADRWLPFVLDRPWPFILGAFLLTAASFLLVPTGFVGEEFIPPADQGIFTAQVVFPAGHPLAATHATMDRIEAATRRLIPASEMMFETTTAGAYSAAFGGFVQEGNVGQVTVYLQTAHAKPTAYYVQLLQRRLGRLAPGATVTVTAQTGVGGGAQQPIDELVTTANGSDPTPYAAKVYAVLASTPGTTGAQDSASNAAPQMEVDFNRPALQGLDVADGTAAEAVEAAFGGDVASTIETPDRGLTDIEVIYPRSAQTQLADVLAIPLRNNNGGIVRLGDVAYLHYEPAPLLITRENRADAIHVSANLAGDANLSDTTRDFLQRLKNLRLPAFVQIHPASLGQQDLMNQALITLGGSLLLSILLVFLVIVALYNSYRTPFVTLFAIPVASIGALGALWITHQTLNLYSLIGTVLLVGLVTKNGILLVDYADTVRLRGRDRRGGMTEAAQTRFRPIMMTTIAMVTGMLPLALGLEPGGQQRASLAIVVIGGLLSSLVLTLFVVPIMYCWLAPEQLREETKFADER